MPLKSNNSCLHCFHSYVWGCFSCLTASLRWSSTYTRFTDLDAICTQNKTSYKTSRRNKKLQPTETSWGKNERFDWEKNDKLRSRKARKCLQKRVLSVKTSDRVCECFYRSRRKTWFTRPTATKISFSVSRRSWNTKTCCYPNTQRSFSAPSLIYGNTKTWRASY